MTHDSSFPPNMAQIILERFQVQSGATAFWVRHQVDGTYKPWTWGELADRTLRLADALVTLGVRPQDRVINVSENRTEWILLDLALHLVQAVHVPVHAALSGPQIAEQLVDCGGAVMFLSTAEQARKLDAVADRLPNKLTLVGMDPGLPAPAGRVIVDLEGLMAEGDADGGLRQARNAAEALGPSSPATILYTSGTTGEPKGVVLTHGNLVSNCVSVVRAFGSQPAEVRLTFLPLSHIFARTCDLYTWIVNGNELALAGSRETVLDDARKIRPTVMNGVPYFFELVKRRLEQSGQADAPGALAALFGGRVEYLCSGGAPLPDAVYDFYARRGLPILQGYGLTESSPVISLNRPGADRRGTVGQLLPGTEVRIGEDGEILARGPHIMAGYWGKPRATEEAIPDGWLHTGDLGSLDQDGYLRITGRKKELIVTAGGKNVAPVYLEGLLVQDPLIRQAMVIGDRRNYLAALIVPDPDALQAEMQSRRAGGTPHEGWLSSEPVRALFRERITERLQGLSHYEQIGNFVLLDQPFTVEGGELTAKLSLRREVVSAKYAEQIERMYAPLPDTARA